jgi:hypothetical protein
LTCLQTGYGGLSLAIRVQGVSQVGAHTHFRAVGRRRGDKGGNNANTALTPCPVTVVRGVGFAR